MNMQSVANGIQTDPAVTLITVCWPSRNRWGTNKLGTFGGGTALAVNTSDWPAGNVMDSVIIQSPVPIFFSFLFSSKGPSLFHSTSLIFRISGATRGKIVPVEVQAVWIHVILCLFYNVSDLLLSSSLERLSGAALGTAWSFQHREILITYWSPVETWQLINKSIQSKVPKSLLKTWEVCRNV